MLLVLLKRMRRGSDSKISLLFPGFESFPSLFMGVVAKFSARGVFVYD